MKSKLLGASLLAIGAALASSGAYAADAAAAADMTSDSSVEAVIVTGTRTTGLKAADSAAPVEVVGSDALKRVGQPDLIQSLAQTVPSFTAEALGGDTANLTLSARLRGLSPNDTLVLVDGKRRHPSANLHVLGGPYQGAATADIGLIPVSAIDHVEVLMDGAAAQYGTDAIAGVVNIILKKNSHGGSASLTAGQYYAGDGATGAGSVNFGTALGDKGFINATAEVRYHDFSQRGGADKRLFNQDGTLRTDGGTSVFPQPAYYATLAGAPRVNHIVGDARSTVVNLMVNTAYDLGSVEAYGFASYSHRSASAYENFRVPSKVIASPVLGVGGSFYAPGELIFAPNGFSPREGLREDDFAVTGGVRGSLLGWDWDLSTTYGRDKDNIYTLDSANRALFIDTLFTPTQFYDGAFTTTQWTTTLDIKRDFAVGMASPLTVAFGGEGRRDSYEIAHGDAGSIYKEGGQSYPGFQPTDAGKHVRTNYAGYIDLALSPIEGLKLDAAGRYEHFSDFGSTAVGKFTGRYDFNPMFAVRGTISSGFRAPTLAEEYYSATNVSPSSAVVQLPPNSAAAHLIGFSNLKPESSMNYSFGFVAHPVSGLSVTLDAYQIDVTDRIVGTGFLYGFGGASNSAAVLQAILAHGNIIDPTVSYVGVSLFTNGVNTRTRGLELTLNYSSDFGDMGNVDWSIAANYNVTKITKIDATPAPIANSVDSNDVVVPQALFDETAISNLTTASPKAKVAFGAYWTYHKFSANLRETIYGPTSDRVSPNGGTYYTENIPTTGITDLELAYALTAQVKIAAGANNLFNKKPPIVPQDPAHHTVFDGSNVYDAPMGFSPYGINGGYYYGRVTFTF